MRKITEEEFLNRLHDSVESLTPYGGYRQAISARCKKCGHHWDTIASVLVKGHGCPECGKVKAAQVQKWDIGQEGFLQRLPKDLASIVKIKSTYKGCREPVLVECLCCGRDWHTRPVNLYRGHGCEVCARKAKGDGCRLSHKVYTDRIAQIHKESILILSVYVSGKDKVGVLCMNCNFQWSPEARRLYHRGCPNCISSKGELEIDRLLAEARVDYTREHTFPDLTGPKGGLLRFDFAVWDQGRLKCLIEFDGEQHHRPVKVMGGQKRFDVQVEIDAIKDEYCNSHGIRLVRLRSKDIQGLVETLL